MGAEQRRFVRRHVSQTALMVREDGSIIGECTMTDVSAGGARLKIGSAIDAPSDFVLVLSKVNAQMRRRCSVAWRDAKHLGVRFLPSEAR